MKKIIYIICFLIYFCCSLCDAIQHSIRVWPEININGKLINDKPYTYHLDSRLEFIDKHHHFHNLFAEAGLGYIISDSMNIDIAYRYTSHNNFTGFPSINIFWQAFTWNFLKENNYQLISRVRLEERKPNADLPTLKRLRERLTLNLPTLISDKYMPIIYEELFFNLNKVSYASQRFLAQNRVFLGMQINLSSVCFWKIGYVNQYSYGSPNSQNQMSHILSLMFNIDMT